MTLFKFMWLYFTGLCIIQGVYCDGLIEVFQWKQIDFNIGRTNVRPKDKIVFPGQFNAYRNRRETNRKTSRDNPTNMDMRWTSYSTTGSNQQPSNQSTYIPYNNVPMGVTHTRGRMFVTVPRRHPGIPATLNYIDMRKSYGNPSPKLTPYPNLATNELNTNFQADPNRIISVYRTSVDACQRLWFIDTGMLEYPNNRMQVQRPSIWIIDLRNDRLIRRFEIPESVVDTGRGLASLTIDVDGNNCDKAFAYIPDLVNSALFVYSFENNRIWSFTHNYFNFDPIAGDLFIGGQSFRWDDGIFSLTMGPMDATGNRTVFFHPMASNNEFIVSNGVLKNETNAARSNHGQDFQLLGSRGRDRQSTMHEYDPRTGVLFYAEIQRNGVGCWNTNTPFTVENHGTVAQDAQRMIYPSDLSIDEEGVIWVMTNSMPIFIYSNLDPNVVNFRVWKQTVASAIQNTVCNQFNSNYQLI